MLVRAVTPPGSFGKVFGFVTTGFNIGGVIAPPVFGYFMDHQQPGLVLLIAGICAFAAIPAVAFTAARSVRRDA